MGRVTQTVAVWTCCVLCASPGFASDWIDFANETATRMNPGIPTGDTFGKDDIEEKDYAWADVDQDGDIDLVVVRKQIGSNGGRKRNVLFMNEGGVLVDRTNAYASDADDGGQGFLDLTADRDVALVDLDGDGWLDMVTTVTYGVGLPKTLSHPRVYRNLGNDGSGNWLGFRYEEARIPAFPIAPNSPTVAFGDVTDDGAPDLYVGDYLNTLEDRLLINDGNGFFTDETSSRVSAWLTTSTFTAHAVIADLNHDGYNDIVKTNALGTYDLRLGYNDPNNPGFFIEANSQIICNCANYFVAVDDLNNDGLLDIVEADDSPDKYFLNLGNGADTQADWVTFTFPNSSTGFDNNTVIADLDKDGWKDVIIADVDVDLPATSNRLDIHHNLGGPPNVTFQEDVGNLPIVVDGPLWGTHDVAVFDINGDTWLDLVIGTKTGTTVWIQQLLLTLTFSYPLGLPPFAALDGSTGVQVQFGPTGDTLDPSSPTMHVSINGGAFSVIPMTEVGADLYSANLPATACLDSLAYYFSASLSGGTSFTDPPSAPLVTFGAVAGNGTAVTLLDEIEGDVSGWTITSDPSLTSGEWEQADPNFTITLGGQLAAPDADTTPSPGVMAFVTQNGPPGGAAADDDVDGGPTYLTSPVLDLAGTDAVISYQRWFFSGELPGDRLSIDVSNDGGGSWVTVASINSTGSAWEADSFVVGDHVTPTATVQVRFFTNDPGNTSITEAGIDDFKVEVILCGPDCPTDINGDGSINVLDLVDLLLCFGQVALPDCPAEDVNSDGTVNVLDLIELLLAFGTTCP